MSFFLDLVWIFVKLQIESDAHEPTVHMQI